MINVGNIHPETGHVQVAPVSSNPPQPNMNVKQLAPSAGLHGYVYTGSPVHIHPNDIHPDTAIPGRMASEKNVRRIEEGEVVEFWYGASD